MLEHMESDTPASKLLSRALEVWAKGYQVIPLSNPNNGHPPDASESIWLTRRQEREDIEQLFRAQPEAKGVGVIKVSSEWSPFIGCIDWPGWNALLNQDIEHMHVDLGERGVVEWLFTGKFEFFEQLESLRKAGEAKRREAQAAEEKPKLPVGLPVTRVGKGDLDILFADVDAVRMILRVLDIPEWKIEAGNFLCVLPGHEEQHPSARLFQDRKGHFTYACFHLRDGYTVRTLPDVYDARKRSKADKLLGQEEGVSVEKRRGGSTFVVWALRLLAEAGVLQPLDDVGLPELKAASDGERKVYEGLKLLFSVRWTYTPGDPTPFSWRFAEDWCGVAQATAGKAVQKFLKFGIIHAADKHKNTTLFLPGRGKRGIRIRFVGRKGQRKSRR
jgi:hypothetical protein